jgi:hypothetical protein
MQQLLHRAGQWCDVLERRLHLMRLLSRVPPHFRDDFTHNIVGRESLDVGP